jgi:hypothetical protein
MVTLVLRRLEGTSKDGPLHFYFDELSQAVEAVGGNLLAPAQVLRGGFSAPEGEHHVSGVGAFELIDVYAGDRKPEPQRVVSV